MARRAVSCAASLMLLAGATLLATAAVDAQIAPSPSCSPGNASLVASLGPSSSRETTSNSRSQTANLTESDVLLGLALHANGAPDVTIPALVSGVQVTTTSHSLRTDGSLNRDDVFSALALGVHTQASALEALACIASGTAETTTTQTSVSGGNVDEAAALADIALHNAAGTPLLLSDVSNTDTSTANATTNDQSVSVSPQDAFLAQALGMS